MLRRLIEFLFPSRPAVLDWTAGWEHRRDDAPATDSNGRRRDRVRPAASPCRSFCRAGWEA